MVTYSAKKMHREIIHDAKIPINRHYYKKKTWSFVNDHK